MIDLATAQGVNHIVLTNYDILFTDYCGNVQREYCRENGKGFLHSVELLLWLHTTFRVFQLNVRD